MLRTFHISTFGCKVNQYDSQAIRERLRRLGMDEAPLESGPELVIVNTCTVTGRADEKCRKETRKAIRANPRAEVVVTGCGAATDAERYRGIEGVRHVLDKARMARIEELLGGGSAREGDFLGMEISGFAGHTRAFLRIQEGCDAFCAYCIVPYARGRVRSRPLKAIRPEVERLVESGHKEVVLTGIHLGAYGRDLDGASLLDAVEEALAVAGLHRLRLSSIEAMEVTPDLLRLMASEPRLCPHLHLPLQSGDDGVLKAMNRGYSSAEFLKVLDRAREAIDRPALTTDAMVGFPGETEAQFQATLDVCRLAGFSRMHVFRYSPRKGTPAAEMKPVDGKAARERERRASALARELAAEYKRGFVGETVEPLVESRRDRETRLLTGLTERYASVLFEGPDRLMNEIVPVKAESARAEALRGALAGGPRLDSPAPASI